MAWDYLIVTASNEAQGRVYRQQLGLRRQLGLIPDVRKVLVVPDPEGRRVGSGGSTLLCLVEVLNRELERTGERMPEPDATAILEGLRILILHAGGDSKRLPAYGPCGKLFVPVPGEHDSSLPPTLFDRQYPTYADLPMPAGQKGQIIITAGDVLLRFDPAQVRFEAEGLTGLASYAGSAEGTHHGVYVSNDGTAVRHFLQKPELDQMRSSGAVDAYDRVKLDIGVLSFDAATAVRLLNTFGLGVDAARRFELAGRMHSTLQDAGLDFYREVCCALGSEASQDGYIDAVRQSGSAWTEETLGKAYRSLRTIPFHVQVLPHCDFLHFGTTRQLIESGRVLAAHAGFGPASTILDVNNVISGGGSLTGRDAWIDGCRITAGVECEGRNVLTGIDMPRPVVVPEGCCIDRTPGRNEAGEPVTFLRVYGTEDLFKDTVGAGATYCNMPILEWLRAMGAEPQDVWDGAGEIDKATLWNARVAPALPGEVEAAEWLWMYRPQAASNERRAAWKAAKRYSMAQIALLADTDVYFEKQLTIRADQVGQSIHRVFLVDSEFSAQELGQVIERVKDKSDLIRSILAEAHRRRQSELPGIEKLACSRILHTLASALCPDEECKAAPLPEAVREAIDEMEPADRDWLAGMGLLADAAPSLGQWSSRLREEAFGSFGRVILESREQARLAEPPRSALRSDEIVWGRAPARLDTGGGWTDTPPYSLEHGGAVVNIAVDLNGQPPIQAYARVIPEPVIRIGSIDLGVRIEVRELDELLDYRQPESEFALAKAAIALAGFSHDVAGWPDSCRTLRDMLERFGGGLELTTLAAIPKGSGLGTSSIMGSVLMAVLYRVIGAAPSPRQLFHDVLRLEQALTTGGGWQDQIGGAAGGAKLITTEAGLFPDPVIRYLPHDVIEPRLNDGCTLLYYTGVTRLAKNILQQIVGRYLNRDRRTLHTLERIRAGAWDAAEAISRKDLDGFGRMVDEIWRLNKELDPHSTNDEVERILAAVRPCIRGAKLLGAGGGGFLLMVAPTAEDAKQIRALLTENPPNARARFFDFNVNTAGLVVTAC